MASPRMATSRPRWTLYFGGKRRASAQVHMLPAQSPHYTTPASVASRLEASPEGAAQSAGEPFLVPRCAYPAGQSLSRQIKGITISQMVSASERRWHAIFKECDVDDDDAISRREP